MLIFDFYDIEKANFSCALKLGIGPCNQMHPYYKGFDYAWF